MNQHPTILNLFAGLLMLSIISSCATQNMLHSTKICNDPAAFRNNPEYQYVIHKDDKISLSIWDHDDMSVGSVYGIYNSNEVYGKWLLVDAAGNITVPKLGEVHVEGMTIHEAEEQLTTRYKKWIVNPVIAVKVLNKEVTVMGELKTPGKYQLDKDYNTLLDVISKAGDFDFYANRKKVQVVRQIEGQSRTIQVDLTKASADFHENIQIYPGDIVYVPSRGGKSWDKRSGSIIVPIATVVSTAVLLISLSKN